MRLFSKANPTLNGLGVIVSASIILAGLSYAPLPNEQAKTFVENLALGAAVAWFFGSLLATSIYYYGAAWASSLAYLGAILNAVGALMTAAAVVIGARS